MKSNKLRLINIYELKGKTHPIELFMIDLLDGIKIVPVNKLIYYKKEDIIYMVHNLSSNEIRTHSTLDNKFEKRFKCHIIERREIMKYLLEKHLNLTLNKVV